LSPPPLFWGLCDFDLGHDHRAGRPGGPFCDTSTPFSVLIGWPVFGERMPGGKALAALTIVAGVIVTRL